MNYRLPDTLGFELRVLNEKMDYLKKQRTEQVPACCSKILKRVYLTKKERIF